MRLEYLFVFYSFDFPWRGLVGIDADVEQRRTVAQADLRRILSRDVTVRLLWKMPVIVPAVDLENWFVQRLRSLHCSSIPSGGWLWVPNVATAAVAALTLWAHQVPSSAMRAMFLLLLPLPVDLALAITILAAVEYVAVGAITLFAWRFLKLVFAALALA